MTFSQKIVQWQAKYGRHDFPWQGTKDSPVEPYHVWLSEIMLQQTQAIKVLEYFDRFITALPTLNDLADADEQQVLALWSGLGYYNRARYLHRTAKTCQSKYQSQLPKKLEQLVQLPGIGRSTAAAIMSLAFGKSEPIMDGNVKRVFARQFLVAGEPTKSSTLKTFWQLAEKYREHNHPAAYTQGLMDLGALVCTKHQPKCEQCPVMSTCEAKHKDVIALYPEKKQTVQQVEVNLFVLLLKQGDYTGLTQRNEKGIWHKLWFLPEYQSAAELEKKHPKAESYFSLTHKLTHRILNIHVYKQVDEAKNLDEHPELMMVNRTRLNEWPHPKALIHILNQHDNHKLH